jgi:hypothetical protein
MLATAVLFLTSTFTSLHASFTMIHERHLVYLVYDTEHPLSATDAELRVAFGPLRDRRRPCQECVT